MIKKIQNKIGAEGGQIQLLSSRHSLFFHGKNFSFNNFAQEITPKVHFKRIK